MAIEGKCRNLYGDQIFGDLSLVVIQATFSSGVATVDTDASSPDVTMVKDATGDYDITFPACEFVHFVGAGLDPATDTAVSQALLASPRSLNAGAGTGKILFHDAATPSQEDPADNQRVYVTLLCGNN